MLIKGICYRVLTIARGHFFLASKRQGHYVEKIATNTSVRFWVDWRSDLQTERSTQGAPETSRNTS